MSSQAPSGNSAMNCGRSFCSQTQRINASFRRFPSLSPMRPQTSNDLLIKSPHFELKNRLSIETHSTIIAGVAAKFCGACCGSRLRAARDRRKKAPYWARIASRNIRVTKTFKGWHLGLQPGGTTIAWQCCSQMPTQTSCDVCKGSESRTNIAGCRGSSSPCSINFAFKNGRMISRKYYRISKISKTFKNLGL